MTGVHCIEVTYEDGRREMVECVCDLCEVWRAYLPEISALIEDFLLSVEPEHRPNWLLAGTGVGDPRAQTDRFAEVRRIATSIGGYVG